MKTALCIGVGGFLGALCRYGLANWVDRNGSGTGFPFGILTVNILGCLLFGLIFGIAESTESLGKELRLFVFTGFLGAFTTFSTFGHDTVTHLRIGQHGHALGNIALSVGLGLLAVWVGFLIAALFTGKA